MVPACLIENGSLFKHARLLAALERVLLRVWLKASPCDSDWELGLVFGVAGGDDTTGAQILCCLDFELISVLIRTGDLALLKVSR